MRDRAQRARNRLDAIAVTHPDAMLAPVEALEQQVVAVYHQSRRSVLTIARANAARAHVLRESRIARSRFRAPGSPRLSTSSAISGALSS